MKLTQTSVHLANERMVVVTHEDTGRKCPIKRDVIGSCCMVADQDEKTIRERVGRVRGVVEVVVVKSLLTPLRDG